MVRSMEMARSGGTVEGAAKIATGVPPDGRLTVDLFPWLELPGSNLLPRKAGPSGYFGVNPNSRSKRLA
jgi:hypothetical protein